MSDENEEEYTQPEAEVSDNIADYEVTYKTPDEINMEKIKMLSDVATYSIVDEDKTTGISSNGAAYRNLFDEEELYRIKYKILEIVAKL